MQVLESALSFIISQATLEAWRETLFGKEHNEMVKIITLEQDSLTIT